MTKRLPVRRPHEAIKANVSNQSPRHGSKVRGIVMHTTEGHNRPGLSDLQGVVGWFNNPASDASSHVIVDNEGHSAKCVPDERKAWTCAAYNSQTLNVEMVGFADHPQFTRAQIEKVAKYVAYWTKKYAIPIRLGEVVNGTVTKTGILTHAQLGRLGGSHHDPGRHFPMDDMLKAARYYRRAGWPH